MGLCIATMCLAEAPIFHYTEALFAIIPVPLVLHAVLGVYILRLLLYAGAYSCRSAATVSCHTSCNAALHQVTASTVCQLGVVMLQAVHAVYILRLLLHAGASSCKPARLPVAGRLKSAALGTRLHAPSQAAGAASCTSHVSGPGQNLRSP